MGREKGNAVVFKRWSKGREQEQNYNLKKEHEEKCEKKEKDERLK